MVCRPAETAQLPTSTFRIIRTMRIPADAEFMKKKNSSSWNVQTRYVLMPLMSFPVIASGLLVSKGNWNTF